MNRLIRSAATFLTAATLGCALGLTVQAHADTTAYDGHTLTCQAAVAYADELVSEYATAYGRALQGVTDAQVAAAQERLSLAGRAYTARRDGCEAGR